MADYDSDKYGGNQPSINSCQAGEVRSVRAEIDLADTGALALNDVLRMVKLPPGHRVVDLQVDCDDLDTNGTPAIVLDVGIEGGDVDAFIDGSTVGQAGGFARMAAIAGKRLAVNKNAEQVVAILVQVAPATGATTGKIGLDVQYAGG